uniref:Uncharacterized protein n=1 Tax=Bionectria ochroleuca TaxID=29856 RepID=A0A0B7K660_BIOOC
MPFPIWCSSCPKDTIIGQGVRFNAKKAPAGKYYSTPIWSFHLRHADCGGEIVIRTDPKNTAERDAAAGEELKDRMSFGYDLLPATEEDARRAALVDFDPAGGSKGIEGARALAKPLFQTTTKKKSTSSKSKTRGVLKAEKEASARKKGFVSEVMGNTRLAQDPFLNSTRAQDTKGPPRLPGVKRKRPLESEAEPQRQLEKVPVKTPDTAAAPPPPAVAVGLVDYDSS